MHGRNEGVPRQSPQGLDKELGLGGSEDPWASGPLCRHTSLEVSLMGIGQR